MKRPLLIAAGILLVYALVLFGALERHVDHPRFHAAGPVPAEADTADCGPGRYGGRVLFGSIGDPKTFNPIVASETSSTDIIDRMFAGLLTRDNISQKYGPSLAKSWDFSEDMLELTYHLRRGVLWSDGVPVTAYDVEFTYDVIYDPRVKNQIMSSMMVNGEPFTYEAVDSLTFRVRTPSPVAPFLQTTGAIPVIPRHILKPELDKGTFDSAYNISWPPEELVTCGPYLLEKFESGVKTVLRRNPNYWRVDRSGDRLPYIERIIFISLRNTETMLLNFQTGTIDMLNVRPSDVPILERDAEKGGYSVVNLGPSMGQSFYWFNLNPGKTEDGTPFVVPHKLTWFTDVRWRKAMAYATDRQAIAETVFNGLAEPQWGPETPANKLWYNPDIVRYPYDLDKARALLDAMELFDRDGDGIREDRDGNVVEFTMLTNTGADAREQIANILKDDLNRVGVRMIFNAIEFNTLIVKIDNEYTYEACLLGLTSGDPDPSSGMNVWPSSSRMHMWHPNQETPATEWEARIDELMELQNATLDTEKRREYFNEMQYVISDNLPYIYLVIPEAFVAYSNRYHNMKPSILRHRLLWNIEEVWIEE